MLTEALLETVGLSLLIDLHQSKAPSQFVSVELAFDRWDVSTATYATDASQFLRVELAFDRQKASGVSTR